MQSFYRHYNTTLHKKRRRSLQLVNDLWQFIIDHVAGESTFRSIYMWARVSVHLSVGALLFEPFDLDFWHEGRP